MIYSTKTKFIALAIIAVILTIAGYFYFFPKPASEPTAVENSQIEKKSLADDESYIKEKVEYFLANNPPEVSEEYARDVIYEEIAFQEQNAWVCNKINDEKIKSHCFKLFLK